MEEENPLLRSSENIELVWKTQMLPWYKPPLPLAEILIGI